VQAAEALDHAHQAGIVHRDVKPANLLLDGRGNLWVTDFGLAHVQHGDASLTATGDVVGTLRYMSPEQALAKRVVIDHRTDVYSLGATLYELLTLQPAFRGSDRQELLRQIAFEEPTPPRRIEKAIPAELETIVLKAMAKSPTERYATAQELADDLQRFQQDRPIWARRPTLGQRLRRWCRRHKPVVWATAAVIVMTVLLGGGAGLWWLQKRAAAQREVELALEEAIRLQEKENWLDALSAARRAEALLAGGSINEALQQRVRDRRADLEMAKKLEDIPVRLNEIGQGYHPAIRASAYELAFREYGIDVAALDPSEAAERIAARTIRLQLAAGLEAWGAASARLEKKRPNKLLSVARALDSDPLRNRLRDALETMDREPLKKLAASEEAMQLGPASLFHVEAALQLIGAEEERARLLQRAQQKYPGNFTINEALGNCFCELKPPRIEDAVRFLTAAVALHPENPGAHINLGRALAMQGNLDGAIEAFQTAVRLSPTFTFAYNNLGAALRRKGDLEGAIRALKEGVRARPDVAVTHLNLASALDAKGDLEGAEPEARECVRLAPKAYEGYALLGSLLERMGRFTEALEVLRGGQGNPQEMVELAKAVRECERRIEVDGKLSRILQGQAQPANNAERLELARLCVAYKQLNLAGVRFFREAFSAQPDVANDPRTTDRYDAACAAALAGCGRGKDAGQSDAKERAGLRQQALEWLRADLAAYRQMLERDADKARPVVRQRLRHWQRDRDLAEVRDPGALAKLPETERHEWQKLWADVAAMLARSAPKPVAEKKSESQ
jgi:tetratricopeptide (TPR) repeat protein